MILDHWVAGCLIPLAIWVLISGLDDLVLDVVFITDWLRSRKRAPVDTADSVPDTRIAIFLPLWREHAVVEGMLEHNLAAARYRLFDVFVGTYPNDELTTDAVRGCEERFPNVHLANCPHDGPTSKADCLNWIYQHMLLYEEQHGVRFEFVVTHDAEDIIHPDSLRWISHYGRDYDMVQIPVLPFPTGLHEFTHGVYCDEFAESQTKDLRSRQTLGGFMPSTGVGCAFSRRALEKLAEVYANRVFEPESLTEDYENGLRIYRLGYPQLFVPIRMSDRSFVATREYFPQRWQAAVVQRTRWITGIALQTWQRYGWSADQIYWFWRDRKALVGNLITPFTNLIFVYGACTWTWSQAQGRTWGMAALVGNSTVRWLYLSLMALQVYRLLFRIVCVSRLYGWKFGVLAPLRVPWGNWINFLATVAALTRFASAKVRGHPLLWIKTEHSYPSRDLLMEHKRRLGEVLVGSQYITQEDLEEALANQPAHLRIGAYLVQTGKLTEDELYEALSLQQNLPVYKLSAEDVSGAAARSLPARISRRWKVLPFKIAAGSLFVAGPQLPSDEMSADLRRFSSLEVRFQLLTPTDYEKLAAAFLPPEGV